MADNKVKFNLKNAHYALMKEDGTYETPVPVVGSVSLTLDPQGETTTEYADGIAYYVSSSNQGYSGSWELEVVTDKMRQDLWGDTLNTDKVLIENALVEPKQFAFLFQIDGDKYNRCMVLYNCTATRPAIGGQTNQAGKTIVHDSSTITAVPLSDGVVKACTTNETTATVASDWFKSVYKK